MTETVVVSPPDGYTIDVDGVNPPGVSIGDDAPPFVDVTEDAALVVPAYLPEPEIIVVDLGRQGNPGPEGPRGPEGPMGEVSRGELNETIQLHVLDVAPHPAYDDLPSLTLLFENCLV